MSLLLNALKKAEDGGKPEDGKTAGQDSASAPVDFDSIVETASGDVEQISSAVGVGEGEEPTQRRERVDAARVFGAKEGGGGSGARKLFVALASVGIVGGGVYGVLVTGLIPGVDMSLFGGIFGGSSDQSVAVAPSAQPDGGINDLSSEAVLLPIPVIDVQSEVDFSDLRLPENSPDILSEDEYVRKIAIYTGYDIEKERERILQESGLLDIEEEVDSADLEPATPEELDLRTADASREQKERIDATTTSEDELNIVIKNAASVDASIPVESAPVAEETDSVVVAQIGLSAEGIERNSMLERARRLYYDGSHTEAEAIYRQVLRLAPTNRDALRGIAQIAVATGRYRLAASTYLDMLNYYPDDPVAISELANLRGSGGEGFYETEKLLKRLLGKSPGVDGRVYFALGNLYAGFGKWYDAQKAYFEAYSRETNNPDYAYNLAVILDYLNKPKVAVDYYRQALDLSGDVLVGFNRAAVKKRINEIEG